MPTASTGRRATPWPRRRNSSNTISTMPVASPISTIVQLSLWDKIPTLIADISVAWGAASACVGSMPGRGRRSHEAIGIVEQIEERRNHDGAAHAADHQRDLLAPRRRADQPARLQVLGTAWRLGVSGRNRCLRERIVGGLESLSEAGAERAVIDGAANLKHKIR